ncbi:histidine triad nucleotide-binding protein [Bacteroidota bacterium]
MTQKTLFQRIADGEIPADFVHEDEQCYAIRDINPQAPTHILIIPRKPIPSNDHVGADDAPMIGHLFVVAKSLAATESLADGYRLVFNCGPAGGQEVPHLHLHLLGGRKMTWPPG